MVELDFARQALTPADLRNIEVQGPVSKISFSDIFGLLRDEEGGQALASLLGRCRESLTELDLCKTTATAAAVQCLAQAGPFPKLARVAFPGCRSLMSGPAGGQALAAFLGACRESVQDIDICNTGGHYNALRALAAGGPYPAVTRLSLRENSELFDADESAAALAELVATCRGSIKELDLSSTQVSPAAVAALAAAGPYPQLERLRFYGCKILCTPEGQEAMISLLRAQGPNLVELSFAHSETDLAGARAVAAAGPFPKLERFEFNGCFELLSDAAGGETLAAILGGSRNTIQQLVIQNTGPKPKSAGKFHNSGPSVEGLKAFVAPGPMPNLSQILVMGQLQGEQYKEVCDVLRRNACAQGLTIM